jgi:hypothetical protein
MEHDDTIDAAANVAPNKFCESSADLPELTNAGFVRRAKHGRPGVPGLVYGV